MTANTLVRRLSMFVAVWLLLAGTAAAQKIPTGTLTGAVTDGTLPLPGVTVSVTSPNQQGTRAATSTVSGGYVLGSLPPGPYAVRFELQGFEIVETTVKISGDLTTSVDAVLPQSLTVTEEVTVTGRYDTISTTPTNATAYESELIHLLPVSRNVSSYVFLTPGTTQVSGAPYYYTQITGGPGAENLLLINGAPASDNYGRYLLPLYIEDAIQETTTSVSGVSAEYGRFTGGVVNALTKSGGNEFHGSLRVNLGNPKWTAPTPLTIERTDELDTQWEGTLGGYILKDRLWFFLGGRTASQTTSAQTAPPVNIPFDQTIRQNRYEGKLTLAISPKHRLIGSYLDIEETRENWLSGYSFYDLDTLFTMTAPESIMVLNYSGVLSNTLFVEGQYSAKKKAYRDIGSHFTDIERGTPVNDMYTGSLYNASWGCAVCTDPDDQRDNSDAFATASLFLSTKKAGSHDLRFGVDLYDDMWDYNEWQSGSGYYLDASWVNIVGTGTDAEYYPVILPGDSRIRYYPIFELSKGTHFKTNSAFVNDVWRLSNRFSFNIGVRYDQNDGTDRSGTKVAKDSKWSPRLSITWDPKGDGATQLTLGYAEYVAAIDNVVANSQSIGGQSAYYKFYYDGPPINAEGNEVETHEALRQVFAWLDSSGGPLANPQLWIETWVPGYQVVIGDDLRSPSTAEWTAGVSRRLGPSGLIRLDYVNKVWSDFYAGRTDLTTGTSEDPAGNVYDRMIIENDNTYTNRKYWGLLLQGHYRFGTRLEVGGNYTYSKLYGTDCVLDFNHGCNMVYYPEYNDPTWWVPSGYLASDIRHKLNLYASWDAVGTRAFAWNLSLLQRYLSGTPYGAWGEINIEPYVTNPGYVRPPSSTLYPFTAVDAYRTDGASSTDLATTFTFRLGRVELYLNPSVTNLFNNQAVIGPSTWVFTADSKPYLNWFNPFTETPRECPQGTACNPDDGYNWQKGPNFGKPGWTRAYQTPRTYAVNVGLKF